MGVTDAGVQRTSWRSRPLCKRYVVGHFCKAVLPVRDGSNSGTPVYWALGSAGGGEFELLGAWMRRATDGSLSASVGADLVHRGVEALRLTVGAELLGDETGLCATPVGAASLLVRSVHARLSGQNALDLRLPTPLHRALVSGERIVGSVHAKLVQAIDRHGQFVDPETALDFVVEVLQRAERLLEKAPAPARALGGAPGRRRFAGGFAVLAPGGVSVPGSKAGR